RTTSSAVRSEFHRSSSVPPRPAANWRPGVIDDTRRTPGAAAGPNCRSDCTKTRFASSSHAIAVAGPRGDRRPRRDCKPQSTVRAVRQVIALSKEVPRMSSPRTARIFALLLLLTAGQARAAGIADHQQCFKIKDPQTKATYSVDLIPGDNAFPSATGCQVKVPAKLLCIDVEKTNVSPVPPGADPGPAVQKSLCYKVKCPKITPTVVVEDQFGSRSVTVNGSSYLCAPVPVPSTTTTTLPGSCTTDGDCDPVTNGQAVCSAGTCVVGSCNPGYGNCNGLVADGCEVTLDSNPANCGSCGTICTAANGTAGCTSSTCTIGSCSAGFTDCNNSVVDGCEAA